MNVSGLRRNIKNLAHNYSDAQIKVREATSNDPWGPSATIMAEVADLTYNVVAFSEIMQMIWKRLNDHGKNWRHVYKSLILLEYLIKTGTEKVAQQCKENIFAVQTLREFQYLEEGKDQGTHVREKAKQLVQLLKDDERLKNERTKAIKAKERFAQHASGFGSDGSIDGPSHSSQRETPPWSADAEPPRAAADMEFVRPQTAGEEELQLQLAMAMSREEAEQEEAKKRSDDVRLQLAISQSEQELSVPAKPKESHLLDLLDIDLGGGASSYPNPPMPEGWGTSPPRSRQLNQDPWSRTSSPDSGPWSGNMPGAPATKQKLVGDDWPSRTESPSSMQSSAVEGWLHNNQLPISNGNTGHSQQPIDPWLAKSIVQQQQATLIDPWLGKSPPPPPPTNADPWQSGNMNSNTNQNSILGNNPQQPTPADPWAPIAYETRPSPVGALSPSSDLDEFDVITNRTKSALSPNSPMNGANNNNCELIAFKCEKFFFFIFFLFMFQLHFLTIWIHYHQRNPIKHHKHF